VDLLGAADTTAAAKQFICRKLSLIGTEASVPTLAAMLVKKPASDQEPHPADMARYALERIPGAAVDNALRNALPKTSGKPKVGIINTLGERGDSKSVSALSKLLGGSDEMVTCAAAAALGKIGGSQATKALADARGKAGGKLKPVVLDAYLKCADQLAEQGKKAEALGIYKELSGKDQPEAIRAAAMRGMLDAMGGTKKGKK
jgi:HEAT repeat protein